MKREKGKGKNEIKNIVGHRLNLRPRTTNQREHVLYRKLCSRFPWVPKLFLRRHLSDAVAISKDFATKTSGYVL